MIFYTDDYTIQQTLKGAPSREQNKLERYAGITLPRAEAEEIWNRIADHKWHISEKFGRDVGFRVAAIDYFENFYQVGFKVSRYRRPSMPFAMPFQSRVS